MFDRGWKSSTGVHHRHRGQATVEPTAAGAVPSVGGRGMRSSGAMIRGIKRAKQDPGDSAPGVHSHR